MCVFEGMPVTAEMAGMCQGCELYLETCAPVIMDGYLAGAECDQYYCEFCPHYDECGPQEGVDFYEG